MALIKSNVQVPPPTALQVMQKLCEPTGKIRVLVPPKSDTAMIEYTCPECKSEAYKEQPWKRPFSTKCDKCGYKLSVPKMKAEAKRESKGK